MLNYDQLTLEQQADMRMAESAIANATREDLEILTKELFFNNLLTKTYLNDVKSLASDMVMQEIAILRLTQDLEDWSRSYVS